MELTRGGVQAHAARAATRATGVLLVNVGTPDAPRPREVRRYLREFLSDPRVIDIPAFARWLLLNLVILPRRPRASAAAYAKIWGPDGSPLLRHSRALAAALEPALGDGFTVALGMRYGSPSIGEGLAALRTAGVERFVIAPLFPQYASASTGTAVQRAMELLGSAWNVPEVHLLGDFFAHPGFIEPLAAQLRAARAAFPADRVLFSYHGLPERQVDKSHVGDPGCPRPHACPAIGTHNRMCYRAQAFETSRRLAAAVGLRDGEHLTTFQSRLGRTPWIKPYTDLVLPELRAAGVKRLLVLTPSFVADCLETEEEVGIRLREQWLGLGGEALQRVPCLNADPQWVRGLADMVRAALG